MLKKFLSLIIIAIAVALSIADPFPVASDLVDTNWQATAGCVGGSLAGP